MIDAKLEIDHERGVIYVHDATGTRTILRICRLPAPIPLNVTFIDVTNKVGSSYTTDEISHLPDPETSWRVRTELVGVKSDLPPGNYDGVIVSADSTIEDDHGVLTLRYALGDLPLPETPLECNGANDGTCPKHPEVNCG